VSAPRIILDKKYQIRWKFDVVMTKIILLGFSRHGVYLYMSFKLSSRNCCYKIDLSRKLTNH